MRKIKNLPPEIVSILGAYVYRLVDPVDKATIYVGKGRGNRVISHINAVIDKRERLDASDDGDELSGRDGKFREIDKILGKEEYPARIIHRYGMGDATAFQVEAALIDAYPESENIARGHNSKARGLRDLDDLLRDEAAESVELNHGHFLIAVSITSSMKEGKNKTELEAAQYAWGVGKRVQNHCCDKIVLAYGEPFNVVKGVYVLEKFVPASEFRECAVEKFAELDESKSNRVAFELSEAPDEIKDLYLDKRLDSRWRNSGVTYPRPDRSVSIEKWLEMVLISSG